MRFSGVATIAASAFLLAGVQPTTANCGRYLDKAGEAANNLQSQYFVNGGYPQSLQWVWISALDAFYLRQLDNLRGSNQFSGVIDTVFNGWDDWLTNGGSYDDVQWVVMAYLQAGRTDQARKYYDIANSAWDGTCGGGLWWSSARDYKNAITNELFLTSSGFMFDRLLDQRFKDNMINAYNWLRNSPMRGGNGLFNDGLTRDGSCGNNGQPQWTYNQGTILAGLGYVYKHTGDESAVTLAWSIMDSIINNLTINGGLREPCETDTQNACNADQTSFKGITMQYMAWFLSITGRDNNGKYSNFIKQQGDKIIQFAAGNPGQYSNLWYAPNQGSAKWTAPSQGSALGGLVAAAAQNC